VSRWSVAPGVAWRALSDGGLFVVDAATGDYLTLNRSAACLIEGAAEGLPQAAIARRASARFGAPVDDVRSDLDALAVQLEELGVLRSAEDDDDPPGP